MKQELFNNKTKAEDYQRQPKQLGLYEACLLYTSRAENRHAVLLENLVFIEGDPAVQCRLSLIHISYFQHPVILPGTLYGIDQIGTLVFRKDSFWSEFGRIGNPGNDAGVFFPPFLSIIRINLNLLSQLDFGKLLGGDVGTEVNLLHICLLYTSRCV